MEAYLSINDKRDENNLDNYLGKNLRIYPRLYCREERQFAALLYSAFIEKRRMKGETACYINKIVGDCLGVTVNECETLVIENVYFEATLMRDFFEKDRDGFNRKLLEFCLGWLTGKDGLPDTCKLHDDKGTTIQKLLKDLQDNSGMPRNFGQSEVKATIAWKYRNILEELANEIKSGKNSINDKTEQGAKEKACLDIARMMMNATPDILVIYTKDGKTYAKALECKYLSDEGRYKDVAGAEYPMQLFIQECIMGFCFGNNEKLDQTDGEERMDIIPKFPERSKIWGDKKSLWENICKNVYKGVLNANAAGKSGNIINTGVDMIRFETDENREQNNKKKEKSKEEKTKQEIIIQVSDLMDVYSGRRFCEKN